jgi:hypothetical protein
MNSGLEHDSLSKSPSESRLNGRQMPTRVSAWPIAMANCPLARMSIVKAEIRV